MRIDPGALYGGRTTTTGGQRRIAHTMWKNRPSIIYMRPGVHPTRARARRLIDGGGYTGHKRHNTLGKQHVTQNGRA